jgi:hypothetical protein
MAGLTHGPYNKWVISELRKRNPSPTFLDFFSLSRNIYFPPYVKVY